MVILAVNLTAFSRFAEENRKAAFLDEMLEDVLEARIAVLDMRAGKSGDHLSRSRTTFRI